MKNNILFLFVLYYGLSFYGQGAAPQQQGGAMPPQAAACPPAMIAEFEEPDEPVNDEFPYAPNCMSHAIKTKECCRNLSMCAKVNLGLSGMAQQLMSGLLGMSNNPSMQCLGQMMKGGDETKTLKKHRSQCYATAGIDKPRGYAYPSICANVKKIKETAEKNNQNDRAVAQEGEGGAETGGTSDDPFEGLSSEQITAMETYCAEEDRKIKAAEMAPIGSGGPPTIACIDGCNQEVADGEAMIAQLIPGLPVTLKQINEIKAQIAQIKTHYIPLCKTYPLEVDKESQSKICQAANKHGEQGEDCSQQNQDQQAEESGEAGSGQDTAADFPEEEEIPEEDEPEFIANCNDPAQRTENIKRWDDECRDPLKNGDDINTFAGTSAVPTPSLNITKTPEGQLPLPTSSKPVFPNIDSNTVGNSGATPTGGGGSGGFSSAPSRNGAKGSGVSRRTASGSGGLSMGKSSSGGGGGSFGNKGQGGYNGSSKNELGKKQAPGILGNKAEIKNKKIGSVSKDIFHAINEGYGFAVCDKLKDPTMCRSFSRFK